MRVQNAASRHAPPYMPIIGPPLPLWAFMACCRVTSLLPDVYKACGSIPPTAKRHLSRSCVEDRRELLDDLWPRAMAGSTPVGVLLTSATSYACQPITEQAAQRWQRIKGDLSRPAFVGVKALRVGGWNEDGVRGRKLERITFSVSAGSIYAF